MRSLVSSQKVGDSCAIRHGALSVVDGVEDVEVSFHMFVNVQDWSDISASVAVVRCWPNCNQILISEPVFESVHNQLMGASNQLQLIYVVELRSHTGSKQPACSSWRKWPAINVIGVRPHEIWEWTFMWEFHASFKQSDLVKGLDIWRQTGMYAENSAFNDSGDAEVIEDFSAVLPGVCVTILSNSLIVKAVSCRNLSRFMVSSE